MNSFQNIKLIFIASVVSILLEKKLNLMKNYVKKKVFRGIVMPSKKDDMSKSNQCMKPDKMSYIIHADLKSLIKK